MQKGNLLMEKYPEIAKQFHPTKNGDLKIEILTCGSGKKIWWQCSNGHEWEAFIYNRAKENGTGCPYCSGNKATEKNNITITHPYLLKEWNYSKNIGLNPENFKAGSNKKVWWVCEMGHEFEAIISNRALLKTKCSYCRNMKVTKENCLATRYPELAKEWHPTKNKNLTPYDVLPSARRKVWWKCSEGHEWESRIDHRNNMESKCPYCSGKRACNDNSLFVLFPDIAKEWDYNKNKLTPHEFTVYSNKMIWWKCEKGHEWKAQICNRSYGTGCPTCNKSKGENKLTIILDQYKEVKYKTQYRIKKCRNKLPLPFDFAIFDKNNKLLCLIEYDGEQHYRPSFGEESFQKTKHNDRVKNEYCKQNNIPLIRVPYWEYNNLETYLKNKLKEIGINIHNKELKVS